MSEKLGNISDAPPDYYAGNALPPSSIQGQAPYQPTGQYPIVQQQPYPQQQPPQYPVDVNYPQQQYVPQPQTYTAMNTNTTIITAQPGLQTTQVYGYLDDHSGLAWFACLCCCWPIGLAAIMKSNEVGSALAANDYPRAQIASMQAKRYANIAIILGLIALPMAIVSIVLRAGFV